MEEELILKKSITEIAKRKNDNVFKSKARQLLKQPITREIQEMLYKNGINIQNGTLLDAMTGSMIAQALNGNIAAYTVLRDTAGYKPVDQVRNDVALRIEMSPTARELGE